MKLIQPFNTIVIAYLVAAHALLGIAIAKTDLVPKLTDKLIEVGLLASSAPTEPENECMAMLRGVHRHMDRFVPTGATLFLGDSITMALATAAVTPYAVNYGIGGQRTDQLIASMDLYRSMERAGAVVITIGTNDLLQVHEEDIGARYKEILAKVPPHVPVIMNSIPPIRDIWRRGRKLDDDDVRTVIGIARQACRSDPRCTFVDTHSALVNAGNPLPEVLDQDGVHLAPSGYAIWIRQLRDAVAAVRR